MPALPPAPDTLRLRFFSSMAEDVAIVNRLYCSYTGIVLVSDANNIAINASGAWGTHLAPLLSDDYSLTGVECLDIDSDSGAVAVHNVSISGSVSEPPVPNQVTMNIKFSVDRRYRGGKPKWYQSGLPISSQNDTATWLSGSTNTWSVNFANFVNEILSFTSSDVTLDSQVNVSYYAGFTAFQNPITKRWRNVPNVRSTPEIDTISAWTAEARFGSQRRRRI